MAMRAPKEVEASAAAGGAIGAPRMIRFLVRGLTNLAVADIPRWVPGASGASDYGMAGHAGLMVRVPGDEGAGECGARAVA